MKRLTHAQFLNALDGKMVSVALHLRLCKQSRQLVDDTVDRWTKNASSMDVSKADDYNPYFVKATKLNGFLLYLNDQGYVSALSVHTGVCYQGDTGLYYVVKRNTVYIGGILHHSATLDVLQVQPEMEV